MTYYPDLFKDGLVRIKSNDLDLPTNVVFEVVDKPKFIVETLVLLPQPLSNHIKRRLYNAQKNKRVINNYE